MVKTPGLGAYWIAWACWGKSSDELQTRRDDDLLKINLNIYIYLQAPDWEFL